MNAELLRDVILKLNGPISPIGCCQRDEESYNNLRRLCGVVDALLKEIHSVALIIGAEGSVKRSRKHANMFLIDIGFLTAEAYDFDKWES